MKPKLRFEVLKRDRFTCRYCGRRAPDVTLEVDHVTPRAAHGSDELENLVAACFDCNRGKRDNYAAPPEAPVTLMCYAAFDPIDGDCLKVIAVSSDGESRPATEEEIRAAFDKRALECAV